MRQSILNEIQEKQRIWNQSIENNIMNDIQDHSDQLDKNLNTHKNDVNEWQTNVFESY